MVTVSGRAQAKLPGGGGGGCSPSTVTLKVSSVSVYKTGAITQFSWDSSPAGLGAFFEWGPPSNPYENEVSVSGTTSFSITLNNLNSGIVPGNSYDFYIYVTPPASTCSTDYVPGTYSSSWQALWFNSIVSNYAWNPIAWSAYVGTYTVSSGPTATASGGVQVGESSGAMDPLGAAQVESQMQFYGQFAGFPSGEEVVVTMTYALQWVAEATTAPCPYGCAQAITQIFVEGNVYFFTPQGATGWVLDGNRSTSVANQDSNYGVPFFQSNTAYYSVSFDACFASDTYYQLFTYLLTNSQASSSAISAASSALSVTGSVTLSVQETSAC